MTDYDLTLGGQPVVVHAPGIGEFGLDEAREMWRQLIADPRRVIGLDVETTAHDTKLSPGAFHWGFRVRTVQLGTEAEAWVLRLDDPAQESAAGAILRDERLRFCSHTRYDPISVWRAFEVDITDRWVDTRLLARIANPLSLDRHDKKGGAEAVDLKALTANKLNAPELGAADQALDGLFLDLWVAQGGKRNAKRTDITRYGFSNVPLDNATFAQYAGLDAIACRRLYPVLVAESQSTPELLAFETWLAGLVVRMQMRGMRVDRERLDAEYAQAAEACKVPEAKLVELIGLTPRQNVKLIAWFQEHGVDFAALGHPTTKSGAPSLDGDSLPLMAEYDLADEARQVVDLLLAYKEQLNTMSKAEEIIGLVDDSFDGRLHPSVDSLGAITARMTSAAPNIQNYAKADPRMRATLLPDEGFTLIGADFDTVELRVLAALAQEPTMLSTIFEHDPKNEKCDGGVKCPGCGDLHQLTADRIGVTRSVGKRVNFLQAYGGGATPLAKATGISVDDALAATRAYREAYPAVLVYSRKLQESSEVRTLTHRRIPATYVTRDGGREAATFRFLNYMIQSSSRDLLVAALHQLAELGMAEMLWVPIHDELILQVPTERLDECLAALEKAMRMTLFGVPISASAVALVDEEGSSRWMTCDRAEEILKTKKEAALVAA
jgi:DNA polymerase-1